MKELIDVQEVAEMVGVTARTIRNRVNRGTMPEPVTGPNERRYWNRFDIEYYMVYGWNEKPAKDRPETPSQRKWREALADAECARWGI